MQVQQIRWDSRSGWEATQPLSGANLVFAFADADYFQAADCFDQLRQRFPSALIVGCSSSGSVQDTRITDGDVIVTAVKLEQGRAQLAVAELDPTSDAEKIGEQLVAELQADDLRHVLVLSDGLQVNGSNLALGLNRAGLPVTGGLAGDGTRFGKTWVMANAPAAAGRIAAIGLYGQLTIKSGCFSGWQEFGAERVVTKSTANVVYEIDHQPALDLYKKYLAEQASGLPSTGLRFPLSVQASKDELPVIRTLLAVDEEAHSLTFAGDVPQGYQCKLMRTDLNSLIDNAGRAAQAARPASRTATGLCLVVSCVGRRLVLGQLTEDELEIVRDNLGNATAITGFYSYGELAPFSDVLQCQLHNQTMTLTTLYEE